MEDLAKKNNETTHQANQKDFKKLVKPQYKLPTLEFQTPSGSTLMALICLMPATVINDRLL